MDQKRKEDYGNYFDKFYRTVADNVKQEDFDRIKKNWTVKTIGERVNIPDAKDIIPIQCDCITHAQEEVCRVDCDNDTWNKPMRT